MEARLQPPNGALPGDTADMIPLPFEPRKRSLWEAIRGGRHAGSSEDAAAAVDELTESTSGGEADFAASASRLADAAEQLASSSFEQTTATTKAASNAEELARDSATITSSVAEIATHAGELREHIQLVKTDLSASTARTIANSERVAEINAVLQVINELADQTNLLALNAAIEAARAGDAGRGFAVVADEVRRLAERSKAAAARINKLIEGAQVTSAEAMKAIEKRGQQLNQWMELTSALAEESARFQLTIEHQQTSTEQCARVAEQIAGGSRTVAAAARDIAGDARQSALAAGPATAPRLGER